MTNKKELLAEHLSKLILTVFMIVSIGALIGAVGYLVFNKPKINPPVAITPPPAEKEITITTDKAEYEQGETVKILAKNNLNVSVWYAKEVYCGASFWLLENCKGEEIPYYLTCLWITYQHDFTKLNIDEALKMEWGGMIYFNFTERKSEQGCYRVVFPYSLKEKKPTIGEGWGGDMIKVYTNEFTIKEKTAIDPRCGQKVKGIGRCYGYSEGYEFNQDTGKCVKKGVSGCSFEIPFNSLEECQKVCEKKCRDESYECTIENIPCCDGLKEVLLTYEDEKGECFPPVPCGSICLPCGNGICDERENRCNCSEDCK